MRHVFTPMAVVIGGTLSLFLSLTAPRLRPYLPSQCPRWRSPRSKRSAIGSATGAGMATDHVVVPDADVDVDVNVDADVDADALTIVVLPPPRPLSCAEYHYWSLGPK
jgi:hypothetical protein